jgi:hypothetical protein
MPTLPTLAAFLETLEILDISTLPKNNSTCSICQEPYPTSRPSPVPASLTLLSSLPFALPHASGLDAPALLPCAHIIGLSCLQHWLRSAGTSCPLCRFELCARSRPRDPVDEYNARFERLAATPVCELLRRRSAGDVEIPLSAAIVREIVRQVPRRMIEVVVRRGGGAGAVEWPGMRMYGSAAATFRAFVGDFFAWNGGEGVAVAKGCVMREEMVEAYVRVCGALLRMRARGCKSVRAPVLLEGMLEGVEKGEGGWRVVVQGVSATVEFERRRAMLEEELGV